MEIEKDDENKSLRVINQDKTTGVMSSCLMMLDLKIETGRKTFSIRVTGKWNGVLS